MGKQVKSYDPYTFTRAAGDNLREMQARWGVRWRLRVEESVQKGVFVFVLCAVEAVDPLSGPFVCSYTNTWPNATSDSWESFWYACTFRLSVMVDSYYEELERRQAQGG